jgi:hypothetical protein
MIQAGWSKSSPLHVCTVWGGGGGTYVWGVGGQVHGSGTGAH